MGALRGLYRRTHKKLRAERMVLDLAADATPDWEPLYIAPTAAPTNGAEGSIYFDSTLHAPMFRNASAYSAGALVGNANTFSGAQTFSNATTTFSNATPALVFGAATTVSLTKNAADTLTLGSGDTLAITTADKLTVGGIIVPQHLELAFQLLPHATATEYWLWTAPAAYTVVGIYVTPSILEGGALTATLVKVASAATPVKTTTPLHTADAIDLNANAYTNQAISLTATGADLALAAGNGIGIDYSAALTTGMATVSIRLKRT